MIDPASIHGGIALVGAVGPRCEVGGDGATILPDGRKRRRVAAQHPVRVRNRRRWPSRRVRLPLPTFEQIADDDAILTLLHNLIAETP